MINDIKTTPYYYFQNQNFLMKLARKEKQKKRTIL